MTSVLELRSVRGTGGGPEKTILHGAALHDADRFAITVCYVRDLRDEVFGIDARAEALGLDYVEVRERHSFDPGIWRQLVTLARDKRVDIIHGHDYKTNLLAWRLARHVGAQAIATSHGWTGQSFRERRVYYPADRWVLRRLLRVIAVSSDVRRQLVEAGARPERVTVLLNGIDPAAFRRDPLRRAPVRQALGLSPTDVVIGAVGRLERQKRFDLLLDVFFRMRATHSPLRLVIVGDGSLKVELERQAEFLGVAGACVFTGHRLDIADLHNGFDLLVQSSEYEGTPNAVLEAMAMETPLIATDVGGTSELALPGAHGVIVPGRDPEALRQAIESVLADPAGARRRAEAARRRVEGALSFGQRTRTLETIYEALVSGRAPTRVAPNHAGVLDA